MVSIDAGKRSEEVEGTGQGAKATGRDERTKMKAHRLHIKGERLQGAHSLRYHCGYFQMLIKQRKREV